MISDLLDKINTAMISEMTVDCVCCESLDANSPEFLYLSINNILLSKVSFTLENMFYVPSVNRLISYLHQARAPPIV